MGGSRTRRGVAPALTKKVAREIKDETEIESVRQKARELKGPGQVRPGRGGGAGKGGAAADKGGAAAEKG